LSDEKTGWITLVGNHQNPGRFWMAQNLHFRRWH
jgi:hypothetical protein